MIFGFSYHIYLPSMYLQLKYHQQRIFNILDSKRIPYKNIDIASSEDDKIEMRERCGNPTALPPRFFKGEAYLGVSGNQYDMLNINIY